MQQNLIFEQKRNISSAFIDSTVKLGIAQAVLLVQDNLTESFNMMGCDGIVYREKYNAFWVFTKTRVHFFRRPDWREQVSVATFPVSNEGFRTNVNTIAKDAGGKTVLTANQEACVLDMEKHRPMRLKPPLNYPIENFPERVVTDAFEKFPAASFGEGSAPIYEHIIRSTQIDMSHHLNNIEYIKLALNVFSDEYLQSHEPSVLEVHYLGESKEGQTLKIYQQDVSICDTGVGNAGDAAGTSEVTNDTDATYITIAESDRVVFEMKITFANN